jgi:prophage tail gpP-like protein
LDLSEVRQPRVTVLANGEAISGVIDAEVQSNAYLGANRFQIRVTYPSPGGPFWLNLPVLIEIQIALNGAQCSFMTGHADSLELDPIRGEAVLHGRDLTALLVAAQTSETFENQTASGIATTLAARHGLTPNVAATTALIGRYYQTNRTRSALSQHARVTSEWEVLTWLADQEGYDVWVDGVILNFQPRDTFGPIATVTPSSCCSLRLRQALDLAAGLEVVVKSWDSQTQQIISQSASNATVGATPVTLTAVRPNLSMSDALGLAQQTLSQWTTHETEISFEMPGDLLMLPRSTLNLTETGSGFDGVYEIMDVERRISFSHGYVQRVTARGLPWTPS